MPRYAGVRFRRGAWYIHYRLPGGKQVEEKTHCETAREASELRADLLKQTSLGTWKPRTERNVGEVNAPDAPDPLTFAELAVKFLRDYASQKRSMYYTYHVGTLKAYFDQTPLHELDREDLDRFKIARSNQVSASTVRKDCMVLSLMLKMAVRWGDLERSPAIDWEKPAEPEGRTRYLTPNEWILLRDAAEPWITDMLELAVHTGLRLKEVVTLTRDAVDLEGRMLWVAEDTKTGARPVPLNTVAQSLLKRRMKTPRINTKLVFTNGEGGTYDDVKARNRIVHATRRAFKRAALGAGSFHLLRHTAASWMVQAGVPLKTVGDVLGHKSHDTTQRYAHMAPGNLHAAVARISDNFPDTGEDESGAERPGEEGSE